MSAWDSYIDNLLAHSKDDKGVQHLDKAVILGVDGSAWTTSHDGKGMVLKEHEGTKIGNCFKSGDYSLFQASGVYLEGIKYQYLKNDDKVVLAKKKDNGAISMQMSKTAIVVGHCKEGCQQGYGNKAVAVIADYLESLNM